MTHPDHNNDDVPLVLLTTRAEVVCPAGDDFGAVEAVAHVLGERDRVAVCERGLSGAVTDAIKGVPHTREYLERVRDVRDACRARLDANLQFSMRLALLEWQPSGRKN